jgi:hypothetical protein
MKYRAMCRNVDTNMSTSKMLIDTNIESFNITENNDEAYQLVLPAFCAYSDSYPNPLTSPSYLTLTLTLTLLVSLFN